MTTSAKAGSLPPRMTVPQAGAPAGAAAEDMARPSTGRGTALIYVALALIALIPGVILKLGIDIGESPVDDLLEELRRGLLDVRFGFGLRFWLGVTGAAMLALLLLYPLRKVLAKRRLLGSISGWFHIHLVLGLAGPVLILYHSNFGLGKTNENVALWTMLVVVVSGIAGHFVYTNASAGFYSGKQKALEQIDAIAATLGHLNAMHGARQDLINELKSFETQLLAPRHGVMASIAARWKVEQRHRYFLRAASWLITHAAQQLGMSAAGRDRLLGIVRRDIDDYMRIARHAASRSVREQIWARWRLFHLPAFLIMSIAMTLHIVAVWEFDVLGASTSPAIEAGVATGASSPDQAVSGQGLGSQSTTRLSGRADSAGPVLPPVPRRAAPRRSDSPGPVDDLISLRPAVPGPPAEAPPVLVVKPKRVSRPAAKPVAAPAFIPIPAREPAPKPFEPAAAVNPITESRSTPARVVAKPAATVLAQSGPAGGSPGSFIERFDRVWVEGPGFIINYGGTYEGCAQRCLGNQQCVMLEYYRPEKKCNLYDSVRPRLNGGSSNVGIKRPRQ